MLSYVFWWATQLHTRSFPHSFCRGRSCRMGQWWEIRSRATVTKWTETRQLLWSEAAGEETPPTPPVASRGVNSCSWKAKSSMARLSERSARKPDRAGDDVDGWKTGRRRNEKYERRGGGEKTDTIRTNIRTKAEKHMSCFCLTSSTAVQTRRDQEDGRTTLITRCWLVIVFTLKCRHIFYSGRVLICEFVWKVAPKIKIKTTEAAWSHVSKSTATQISDFCLPSGSGWTRRGEFVFYDIPHKLSLLPFCESDVASVLIKLGENRKKLCLFWGDSCESKGCFIHYREVV